MLSELKYSNNIIFQKGAAQELLTNIKNYPVIDIDYVEDAEVDEQHGDTIWTNYTEGSPCIKITYGDESTTKGNSMFAADFRRAKAKGRAKIIELSNQIRGIDDQKRLWEKVYKENKKIYDLRFNLLQNLGSTFEEQVHSITQILINDGEKGIESIEALKKDYNSGFTVFWEDTYYPTYIHPSSYNEDITYYSKNEQTGEFIESSSEVNNNNYRNYYILTTLNDTYLLQKEKITYILNSYGPPPENSYNSNTIYYYKSGDEYIEVEDQTTVTIDNYLDYYIQLKVEHYFPVIQNAGIDSILSKINGYLGEANLSTEVRAAFQNVKENILAYPQYDSNGQTFTEGELDSLWSYIITYLTDVVNSANIKVQSAETIWTYYNELAGTTEEEITNLTAMIETCNNCADLIANGTKAVNAESDNIIALRNDINTFINDIANGSKILSENTDLSDTSGVNRSVVGYKYVKVGSNITFNNTDGIKINGNDNQKYGTFIITINGNDTEVPIKGFQNSDTTNLYTNTSILPSINNGADLGSNNNTWDNGWITHLYTNDSINSTIGSSTTAYNAGYIINLTSTNIYASDSSNSAIGSPEVPFANGYFSQIKIGDITIGGSGGSGDAGKFLRGDGQWSSGFSGYIVIDTSSGFDPNTNYYTKSIVDGKDIYTLVTDTSSTPEEGVTYYTDKITINFNNNDNDGTVYNGSTYNINTEASIYTIGGIAAEKNIWGAKIFNAVFNDYAECRRSEPVKPGHIVVDQDNGIMICSTKRLQPGAQVVSDTYGHLMGMTDKARTPIAVAGRALVYTYQDRRKYHAGMAVCSAPNGTVDIMTREEIRDYPDCIVGIVSEIPNYDVWGSDNIKVNGRIWIKVR